MAYRGMVAALVGATAVVAATFPADAQPRRVQVGTLACSISAGVGLVVASQRNVSCNFQPDGGPPEAYTGTMTRVGVDVGFTTGGAMVWGVFADTNRYAGMLSGTYAGATERLDPPTSTLAPKPAATVASAVAPAYVPDSIPA